MVALATLNAALLLPLQPTVALADQTLGTFGNWTVTSGTTENQPSCSVSSPIADGSPALVLSADLANPAVFTLVVSQPNWSFPSGSAQTVTLAFDTGKPQTLTGNGSGDSISVNLDSTTFKPFLHGFTAGQSLSISAPGDITPGVFGLGGTTAAVTALGRCTVADGFTQLPLPFAPATPATEAAARASMQVATTAVDPTASVPGNTPPDPTPPPALAPVVDNPPENAPAINADGMKITNWKAFWAYTFETDSGVLCQPVVTFDVTNTGSDDIQTAEFDISFLNDGAKTTFGAGSSYWNTISGFAPLPNGYKRHVALKGSMGMNGLQDSCDQANANNLPVLSAHLTANLNGTGDVPITSGPVHRALLDGVFFDQTSQ